MNMKNNAALVAVAVGFCLANTASAETLVEQVRVATERFADVTVAEAEGYGPVACVSGAGAAGGAMGIHYVNPSYLNEDDNTLDLTKPEAVMYEPQADGSLVLLGVEYITFEGPGCTRPGFGATAEMVRTGSNGRFGEAAPQRRMTS